MNQDQNQQNDSQPESGSQAKRNPIERVIVWGAILILLVILVIEYRAKQRYDASISALQKVANGLRDVSIDEARGLLVGFSQQEGPQPNAAGFNTYHYRWFSLFKGDSYQLTLVENEDHTLKSFDGPAFAEDPDVLDRKLKEANSDDVDSTPPLIGNARPQDPPAQAAPRDQASDKQQDQAEKKSVSDDYLN